jgi:hypothetical protein
MSMDCWRRFYNESVTRRADSARLALFGQLVDQDLAFDSPRLLFVTVITHAQQVTT